jgi:hypothetical protein
MNGLKLNKPEMDLLTESLKQVANFAENLAEHANGAQLVKYILIFSPAW